MNNQALDAFSEQTIKILSQALHQKDQIIQELQQINEVGIKSLQAEIESLKKTKCNCQEVSHA